MLHVHKHIYVCVRDLLANDVDWCRLLLAAACGQSMLPEETKCEFNGRNYYAFSFPLTSWLSHSARWLFIIVARQFVCNYAHTHTQTHRLSKICHQTKDSRNKPVLTVLWPYLSRRRIEMHERRDLWAFGQLTFCSSQPAWRSLSSACQRVQLRLDIFTSDELCCMPQLKSAELRGKINEWRQKLRTKL